MISYGSNGKKSDALGILIHNIQKLMRRMMPPYVGGNNDCLEIGNGTDGGEKERIGQ